MLDLPPFRFTLDLYVWLREFMCVDVFHGDYIDAHMCVATDALHAYACEPHVAHEVLLLDGPMETYIFTRRHVRISAQTSTRNRTHVCAFTIYIHFVLHGCSFWSRSCVSILERGGQRLFAKTWVLLP